MNIAVNDERFSLYPQNTQEEVENKIKDLQKTLKNLKLKKNMRI